MANSEQAEEMQKNYQRSGYVLPKFYKTCSATSVISYPFLNCSKMSIIFSKNNSAVCILLDFNIVL